MWILDVHGSLCFNPKCLYSKNSCVFVCLCLCNCCVFSRHNHTNSWSSNGCKMTFASSGVTSCLCNHTTNFAVLMNYLESTVNYVVLTDPSILLMIERFCNSLLFSVSVTVESWGRAYFVQADIHWLWCIFVCIGGDPHDVHCARVSIWFIPLTCSTNKNITILYLN